MTKPAWTWLGNPIGRVWRKTLGKIPPGSLSDLAYEATRRPIDRAVRVGVRLVIQTEHRRAVWALHPTLGEEIGV